MPESGNYYTMQGSSRHQGYQTSVGRCTLVLLANIGNSGTPFYSSMLNQFYTPLIYNGQRCPLFVFLLLVSNTVIPTIYTTYLMGNYLCSRLAILIALVFKPYIYKYSILWRFAMWRGWLLPGRCAYPWKRYLHSWWFPRNTVSNYKYSPKDTSFCLPTVWPTPPRCLWYTFFFLWWWQTTNTVHKGV